MLDRRAGGKRRFLELRAARPRAPRRPDVVWAHFLVPAGLFAREVDAPLVVTAHGRDVRNIGALPGVAALTRRVVRRASTVIAVSEYLRRELEDEDARRRAARRRSSTRASTSSASPRRAGGRRCGSPRFVLRRRR